MGHLPRDRQGVGYVPHHLSLSSLVHPAPHGPGSGCAAMKRWTCRHVEKSGRGRDDKNARKRSKILLLQSTVAMS